MQRHPHLVPLSHQHHDALALCVLVERSLLADSSAENLARQAAKAVHFSLTEGENHFALEEEILFPLVEQTLGGHPLLTELCAEHAELRTLAGRLAAQPVLEDLEAFVVLLRQHVRKEERDFFADVQERLPEDSFAIAGQLMKERMIQVCVTG
ncbi:MAG: hemerythrin domain-containing protein [Bryobacterales bacterium]|nr:hemerythrin domain-containing protein [Bryobacterales bacterium]